MRSVLVSVEALVLLSCGDGLSAGPIVDNLDWTPSDAGAEFFGVAPEGAICPVEVEGDCPSPEEDEQCEGIPPDGSCVASFIPECLQGFTVLAIYTRQADGSPRCNWITLEQPSLRPIRAGAEIELRAFHFALTTPFGEQARVALVVGDQLVVERLIQIPQPFNFITASWVADRDFPEGTRILFHVDNHGNNEYGLVELNICNDREVGDDGTPCFL